MSLRSFVNFPVRFYSRVDALIAVLLVTEDWVLKTVRPKFRFTFNFNYSLAESARKQFKKMFA